jgi:putative PIG3 family NAD(P)H quinone oxidoreductase
VLYINIIDDQQLIFDEMAVPTCRADEVLVEVKAIGINRADILQRQGKYPAPKGESAVLGIEICGAIIQCGSAVKQWHIGQRVFALVAGGGYAQVVSVKSVHLIALPSSLTYQQGAALAEVFLTAYQSLFMIGQLKPNDNVLIHAGASGVGSALIQLAKASECDVVVTVSSQEKADACIALGADHAIVYHHQDFVTWSRQNLPSGFNLIIDVVAGGYLNKNIDCAALDAHLVVLSMLAGRFSAPVDIAKLLQKRLTISASTLRNRSDKYKQTLVNQFVEQFYPLITDQTITAVIDSVYPWQDVEKAHQRMLNNENIGKLILQVN